MNELISDKHRENYRKHYANFDVASRPSVWLPRVEAIADMVGAKSILDYGCGAARGISKFSRLTVEDYDPGVPACSDPPLINDFVVSIHMLEHVEPDRYDKVIADMVFHSRLALLIVVSCEASTKVLPDGSPWHSFVKPARWWEDGFTELGFTIIEPIKASNKEVAAIYIAPNGRLHACLNATNQ